MNSRIEGLMLRDMMKTRGVRALMLVGSLLLLASVGATGCDEDGGNGTDFTKGKTPDIFSNKTTITFNVVEIGKSSTDVFRLENKGEATLEVETMTLNGSSDFVVFTAPGVEYAGESFSIDPGEFRDLQVQFTPSAVGSASADLTIESNDPDTRELVIALRTLETGPQPQVNPSPIVFGQVLGGETAVQDVIISNVGSADLEITNIRIEGSLDFSPEPGAGTREAVLLPADPIEPGDSYTFKMVYTPPVQGPDLGELLISYNFGSEARVHKTDINANGADPCIRIEPADQIDFGQAVIGKTKSQQVTVQNCGTENLTIYDISLSPDTDTQLFALTQLPPELQAQQDLVLASGSARTFFTTFSPSSGICTDDGTTVCTLDEECGASGKCSADHTGTLVLASDAPNRESIEVPIVGTGSTNNCPTAVAKARVKGNPNAPFLDQVVAQPLDYLELSAEDSFDADGDAIVRYSWSLVQAPSGFSLGFEPNNTLMLPQIQLALVGDYVFELNVWDENEAEACETARINVKAKSDKKLIIELTWRSPGDPDPTNTGQGAGTDLDLHFLEPDGIWNDGQRGTGTDCFFLNLKPEWGDSGTLDDNPNLDRDDIDTGGPEQVNVKEPHVTDGSGTISAYNQTYQIGVYYYDAYTYGSSLATIRIFLDGSQTAAVEWPTVASGEAARELVVSDDQGQGDFWLAGELEWTTQGGNPIERNELYTGFPDYGCNPVCDSEQVCVCN